MSRLLFVYGTLKRSCSNHRHLADQTFIGPARTRPGFRLYDFRGYPAIVTRSDDIEGVVGEVWAVDDAALERLDEFEGVHEGLYRREPIPLLPPFADQQVDAYFPATPVVGGREIGAEWIES